MFGQQQTNPFAQNNPTQSTPLFGSAQQPTQTNNPFQAQMNPQPQQQQFPMQPQQQYYGQNPLGQNLQQNPMNQQMPSGMMNPGMMNPGTGMMNPGMTNPGMMNPGIINPGMMNPGMMNPGMMNSGMMNSGMMNPGMMNPGVMNPGMMNPGMMPGQQQNLQQYPLSGNLSILNQPQILNLIPSNQQNFTWKINQKADPFSVNIGNTLRDKEVQTLAPQFRTRVTQYENQLEENKKYLKMSAENKRNIQEISSKLKKDVYSVTNNSILLRNELKKEKFIFEELKNEINVNATIVNDFLQYNDLYKKGRLQIIQVPSQFLIIAVEKMLNSLNVLKKKIDEILDLAKIQILRKETLINNELDDEYEFFIYLIGELYQYFIYVAHLVLRFDENYMEFRTNTLEYYKSMGYTDLERTLEHESKKLYKDEMIENLLKIVNKLEENKKIEKEQEKVWFY